MTDKEFDDGLKAVMGGRFSDGTDEPVAIPNRPEPKKPVRVVHAEEIPVEEQWEPEKPAKNYLDKLKAIVKDVFLYAVISSVVFWWQQTGRLEETTAWYALLVCVGMVFFSVGRNCRKGDK